MLKTPPLYYRRALMNHKITSYISGTAALLLALSCTLSPNVTAVGTTETIPSQTLLPTTAIQGDEIRVFPDVQPTDWFYDDVYRLIGEDILHGYSDGLFHPEQEVSNAEFVKMLMIALDFDVSETLDLMLFDDHWASRYISFAYKHDILTDDDLIEGFDPDAPITREAMTRMTVLGLGIDPVHIDAPFSDSSDIYADTAYREYLLRGYLVDGDTRIYDKDGTALRSEASSIIRRILDYRDDPYSYKRDVILENAADAELNTESELLDLFYVLNREFIANFTFKTSVPYDKWASYYRHANVIHLEHFYSSYLHCSYISGSNTYNLTFEYKTDIDILKQYHSETQAAAEAIVAEIITDDMDDRAKIKAIHDYIVLNCAYDYENYAAGTIPFEARLAYGALIKKSAVCQGYTAAFNLLCKEAGVRSVVVTGTSPTSPDVHAWNMVLVDGKIYYIDITHNDPVPDQAGKVSYKYFMFTSDQMLSLGYLWDKSHSDIKYFY